MLTEQHFRSFLIGEVMRSCNADIRTAIEEVDKFTLDARFKDGYEKWKSTGEKKSYKKGPKHFKEFF